MKRCVMMFALAIAAVPLILAAGRAVRASDDRLMAADDSAYRLRLVAHCGKRGDLMQNPRTGEFSCIWTNPDGSSIAESIPQYPLLDQLAAR
jgi:hypothetical protein